jgi:hypothetical protein
MVAISISASVVQAQMETPLVDTTQPTPDNTQPIQQSPPPVQQQQSPPLTLHGGLEHSERLAPVEPHLQAGSIFNEQALQSLQPNNEWYWIPSWYAGRKHGESETILRDHNFQTGQTVMQNRQVMNRQDLDIGFQPDRNGQVWEFKRAPYTTTVESNTYFTTMMVRSRDPVTVNQNVVVIRMVQTSVNVDKRSRRILKTMQQEQINTYYPSAQGVMTMQTSIRSFGADGLPLVEESGTRLVYDRAPFTPIDSYDGRDMRLLFRDYMLSHGMSNYLPAYLLPQQTNYPGNAGAPPASPNYYQPQQTNAGSPGNAGPPPASYGQ